MTRLEEYEERTQSYYEKYAVNFAQSRDNMWWPEVEVLKKYVDSKKTLLDVGCGDGRLLRHINLQPHQYVGVDSSKKLIEIAQQKYPRYTFLQQDMKDMDLNKQFDIVCCIASLQHILDTQTQINVLQQCCDLLNQSGLLFIVNWNVLQAKHEKLIQITKNVWSVPTSSGHTRYYYAFGKNEVKNMLESCGCNVTQHHSDANFVDIARKQQSYE